jgi:hypothetical protein
MFLSGTQMANEVTRTLLRYNRILLYARVKGFFMQPVPFRRGGTRHHRKSAANIRLLKVCIGLCSLLLAAPGASFAHTGIPAETGEELPAPFISDNETIYPLSASVTETSIRQHKTGHTSGKPTPSAVIDPQDAAEDYRVNYQCSGAVRGTIGGLSSGRLEKNVYVKFTGLKTGRVVKIYCDTLDYDGKTGYLNASGLPGAPVRMVATEAVVTGSSLYYSVSLKSGSISDATVDAATFHLRGDVIEMRTDGSYFAREAMFTSCRHGDIAATGTHNIPDYRISAGQMTVMPDEYVSARRVTLYLGDKKTLPLPSFRRNLNTESPISNLPLPSYNKRDGITMHLLGSPVSEMHRTFDYDILTAITHLPTGYLLFQDDISRTIPRVLPPRGILPSLGDPLNSILAQFTPPSYKAYTEGHAYEEYPDRVSWYAVLGNQQLIFNRMYANLALSRLPEAGIHFGNILGHLPADPTQPQQLRHGQIANAPALLEAYASFGVLHESPTGITSGRAFTRINFATQPWIIGRRLSWRFAATNWLNAYTRGTVYELFSPEVEMDYSPTRTSLFSSGYRYLTDTGSTPFLSDRRDIRHELRLQFQVGGPYIFGIISKFDLEEMRGYDQEISVVRRLDCIQYGFAYHTRTQSFNIIVNLLPVVKKDKE